MRKHPFLFLQAVAAALFLFALVQHDSARNTQAAATHTEFQQEAASVERQLKAIEPHAQPWTPVTQIKQ